MRPRRRAHRRIEGERRAVSPGDGVGSKMRFRVEDRRLRDRDVGAVRLIDSVVGRVPRDHHVERVVAAVEFADDEDRVPGRAGAGCEGPHEGGGRERNRARPAQKVAACENHRQFTSYSGDERMIQSAPWTFVRVVVEEVRHQRVEFGRSAVDERVEQVAGEVVRLRARRVGREVQEDRAVACRPSCAPRWRGRPPRSSVASSGALLNDHLFIAGIVEREDRRRVPQFLRHAAVSLIALPSGSGIRRGHRIRMSRRRARGSRRSRIRPAL